MVAPKVTLADCTLPATASVEEIESVIKLYGGCVVKGLFKPETCNQALAEFQPYLDNLGTGAQKWNGTFFPSTTKKVAGLITKSDTYASMILNETLLHIAHDLFAVRHKNRFYEPRKYSTCKPQIHVTDLLEIHSGGKAQVLHRDDSIYHNILPKADVWTKGRDVSILNFVALSRVTPDNGGTLFVPGSHLWGDEEEAPNEEDALKADMETGDVFMMLCSTYHGGGNNILPPEDPLSVRSVALIGYSAGWLKQEENQYIALDWKKLATMPRAVQELAGWTVGLPMLGWYDHGHPLNHLGHDIPNGDHTFFDNNQDDTADGEPIFEMPSLV